MGAFSHGARDPRGWYRANSAFLRETKEQSPQTSQRDPDPSKALTSGSSPVIWNCRRNNQTKATGAFSWEVDEQQSLGTSLWNPFRGPLETANLADGCPEAGAWWRWPLHYPRAPGDLIWTVGLGRGESKAGMGCRGRDSVPRRSRSRVWEAALRHLPGLPFWLTQVLPAGLDVLGQVPASTPSPNAIPAHWVGAESFLHFYLEVDYSPSG